MSETLIQTHKPTPPRKNAVWTMYCDASCSDGTGGVAFTVWADGLLYYARSSTIVGDIRSGRAEFMALMQAMQWVHNHMLSEVTIYSDNQGVVAFMNGNAKYRETCIVRIGAACRHYQQFGRSTVEWVEREDERLRFTDFLSRMFNVSNETIEYYRKESHDAIITGYYNNRRVLSHTV